MGLVRISRYGHVDCDADGCLEWRQLTEPMKLDAALAEIVRAGWLVVWTDSGPRTYCQGCRVPFAIEVLKDIDGLQIVSRSDPE